MKKLLLCTALVLILVTLLFTGACSSSTPSSTTAPSSSAAASTSNAAQSAAAPSQQILKIGVLTFQGWPLGVDMMHGVETMADMVNSSGGLAVGNERYKIQLVEYDSNGQQNTAVAAVNRIVFEDKAKYLVSDGFVVDPWLPITDGNKVIAITGVNSENILSPDLHYSFQGAGQISQAVVMEGWIIRHNTDKKSIVVASPDSQGGHATAERVTAVLKHFGLNAETIFYPSSSTDLSALGTKVKTLNPDMFSAEGGGPATDGLAIKSVYQAGWRGLFIGGNTGTAQNMLQVVPVEALEGSINGAWPVEFDPALTPVAKQFKDAYTAKYGKWDGPEVQFTMNYSCLIAALQKAGSIDTDKVAEVIGNGLKFEGPTGTSLMVARPDKNNTRTIDSVCGYSIKKISQGKPVLISTITTDEAVSLYSEYLSSLPK
jgi:branched-chain amino acid transport system substrate-binding protein